MRSSILPILALVLYNSGFGVAMNIGRTEIETTKFSDLNEDCLYLTFDKLDLIDLTNAAQMNSKCNGVATDIFRRKYSGYEVHFVNVRRDDAWDDQPYEIGQSPNFIRVRGYKGAANLMKSFGNQIKKVNIRNVGYSTYTLNSNWTMINRIVNQYGSESLTELNLGEVGGVLWSQFSVPFKNVETLEIDIAEDTDALKLNQLCPNLRRLHIKFPNGVDKNVIDCALPHLEHVNIPYSKWTGLEKDQIIGMIKKNPQIRSFHSEYATPDVTKAVNEYLPNLENLTLEFNDDRNQPLHFKSVKLCVLHTSYESSIKDLSFAQLESFKTTYWHEELVKYTDFFRRHSNLRELDLWASTTMIDLEQLLAELPNLEVMILRSSDIRADNVIKFIESHPKFMKFQFPAHKIENADRKILRERFEPDWNIIDDGEFLFEKKTRL